MSVWTRGQLLNHREIAAVENFFAPMSHASVLKYCFNLNRNQYPKAPALAASTVVVCLDTEGWDADSNKLKELGFNAFDARDMTAVTSPGPWGEDIIKNVYFYLARIQKNAHLKNKNASAGDPNANRFGTQRFLNDHEVKDCLAESFGWPLNLNVADGCVRPVVLLGHALDNDVDKITKLLHWSPRAKGNLVKEIDTQVIARDVGHWSHRVNEIGLQRLVGNMGFQHRDGHTASNDAAMTTIAAVQLILDGAHKGATQPYSLQHVVDNIELRSRKHDWYYGVAEYCFRCGGRDHMEETGGDDGGRCRRLVFCDWCYTQRPLEQAHYGHRTAACVMKAYETSNCARPGRRNRHRGGPKAATHAGAQEEPAAISPVANGIPQLTLGGENSRQPPVSGASAALPDLAAPRTPLSAAAGPPSWSDIASRRCRAGHAPRQNSHSAPPQAPSGSSDEEALNGEPSSLSHRRDSYALEEYPRLGAGNPC